MNYLPLYLQNFNKTILYAYHSTILLCEIDPERFEISSFNAFNTALQYCKENNLVVNKENPQQLMFGNKRDKVTQMRNTEATDEVFRCNN